METQTIVLIFVAFLMGILISILAIKLIQLNRIKEAKNVAQQIIDKADSEGKLKADQYKTKINEDFKIKKDAQDLESSKKQSEQDKRTNKLKEKEIDLTRRFNLINESDQKLKEKESYIKSREKAIKTKDAEVERLLEEENRKLELVANMTEKQAREQLTQNLEEKVKHDCALMTKNIRDKAKNEAEKDAKKILTIAIQRCSAEHVVETTVSSVPISSDEIKGRVIGREGRNIRAFEEATGVDVIVDDTPDSIVLSCFEPVKREIARMALEKLIADGRIHPSRIEEVVKKATTEMDVRIKEVGEQVAFDLDIQNIKPEIIQLLGRINYRTSYGQNVLAHSKEVAVLAGHMASELGLDVKTAIRAGLLHDIGKAIDRESEGTHAQLGGEQAVKYGENEIVVNAIAGHHEDIEPISLYPILIQAADALSATRPGARLDNVQTYIKRLEKLEEIAESFKGVNSAYALQAGREVRVMVEPEEMNDAECENLASEVAQKIELDMDYPGQIKITVIRDLRITDYAK